MNIIDKDIEQKDAILAEIEDILINIINVKPELINEKNYDESLSGKVFKLKGRDILYIFNELERRLEISINVYDILNYEFNSINGIRQCVKALVNPM